MSIGWFSMLQTKCFALRKLSDVMSQTNREITAQAVWQSLLHAKRKSRVENKHKERLRAKFAMLLDLQDHELVSGKASAEPQWYWPISVLRKLLADWNRRPKVLKTILERLFRSSFLTFLHDFSKSWTECTGGSAVTASTFDLSGWS